MNDKIINGKSLIILDLDGTLGKLNIDWISSRSEFKKYALSKFCVEFKDNMRMDEMEAFLLNEFGNQDFEKIFYKRRILEANGVIKSSLNMDLIGKMKHWRNQGIGMAICSNNLTETVCDFLSFHKLIEFIDIYVGVDSEIPPKPDTKGLKQILKHMGVSARDAVFIGDNMGTDGEAAKKMKIDYLHIKIQ